MHSFVEGIVAGEQSLLAGLIEESPHRPKVLNVEIRCRMNYLGVWREGATEGLGGN
ncbi:MAG TPA: hypothetical protein VJN92_09320 [Candidatus Acidoferrum sp.]|nr:hypothetical protein [Candidatus Acidoferrum sp.]